MPVKRKVVGGMKFLEPREFFLNSNESKRKTNIIGVRSRRLLKYSMQEKNLKV